MKSAIAYIRVSTLDQVENGISLEAQENKIKSWCEFNEYELDNIYRDAGISGKSLDKREGLQSALNNIQHGQALIVYSLSRLARNTKDTIIISEQLEQKGCDLVSIAEKIDTTSAIGKFFFTLLAALGQLERDQTSERTKMVLAHKKTKGELNGRAPYGYKFIDKKLVPEPTEQEIIGYILSWRKNKHFTYKEIPKKLKALGYSKRDGGEFSITQIARIEKRGFLQ